MEPVLLREIDALAKSKEVNGDLLETKLEKQKQESLSVSDRILTGPNCAAAPLVMALRPLRDRWGIRRVVVSTYQSTSGAGMAAMEELSVQTIEMMNQKSVTPKTFPHQIAFNCLPHIGSFKEDGYTSEEQKIILESRKMLNLPDLRMTATAVRVPTFTCHAESVNVECERPISSIQEVREALQNQPGLVLQDDTEKNIYPLGLKSENDPIESATGKDSVYLGRLRKDPSVDSGLNFWLVSDNLRKGAALNAIQIAELLIRKGNV